MSAGVGIFAQYGVRKPVGDDQGGFWQRRCRSSVSFRGDFVSGLRVHGLIARPCRTCKAGLHINLFKNFFKNVFICLFIWLPKIFSFGM